MSYTDDAGIHSVEVVAETLFEAVAQAVSEFKDDKTVPNPPGLETEFTVRVLRKPVEHFIRLKRVADWAAMSNVKGPAEALRRDRVRKLLA